MMTLKATPTTQFEFDSPLNNLNDIDKLLIIADNTLYDGHRSAAIIGQAHVQIMRAHKHISFTYLERRYRFLGSQTYLLAAPAVKLPPGITARHLHTKKRTKYYVWIGVNGPIEANASMKGFGLLDQADNLEKLDQAGFLVKS